MKIVSLTLNGYRQYLDRTTLKIPLGLTGICGPNGVGKSKLIESIAYAFYGPRQVLPKGDKASDLLSKAGDVPLRVEVILELRGKVYKVVRSSEETFIYLKDATDALAETPTGVTNKMIELLRLSPDAFMGTFVARQRDVARLQALKSKNRQRLVNRLIGISQVEEAISLAQEVRAERRSAWNTKVNSIELTSKQAKEQLETRQVEHANAVAKGKTQDKAVVNAKQQHEQALKAVGKIRDRANQIRAWQKQCQILVSHYASEQKRRHNAHQRRKKAADAAKKVNHAQIILSKTENAPTQLARLEALAQVSELVRGKAHLERELEQRIYPLLRERKQLKETIEKYEAALSAFNKQIEEWKREWALAEQSRNQALEEATRYNQQRETALTLGDSGVCEMCGQTFGNQLNQALAHYADKVKQAESHAQNAFMRAKEAKKQQAALRKRIEGYEEEKNMRLSELQDYETVPGEKVHLQRDLRKTTNKLKTFPDDLLRQRYDPSIHERVRGEVKRRQQALATVERFAPLAAQEEAALVEERDAEQKLKELAAQKKQLEEEINRLTLSPEAKGKVNDRLAETEKALKLAQNQAEQAIKDVAAAATRIETAEEKLQDALRREKEIAKAHHSFLVSERTVELLEQVLTEITTEARPRLVEFMESWARSLLGPRFRCIDLTEDYRIIADNGSGRHYIEHFSGGEQTLLAVMLRVAISLFCRERAGFDTGFLILDEVFGDQDSDHRAQLVQFLDEIKEHYHQILVVNHVEDVTEMLDNIIDVYSTGPNMSSAMLRE